MRVMVPAARATLSRSGSPRPAADRGPRLAVSRPDDRLEREADRIADAVMAGTAAPAASSTTPAVQRQCSACEDEQRVARRAAPGAAPVSTAAAGDLVTTGGRPLEPSTRAFMESRFGFEFGSVRIHDDASADASARAVRAQAYTVGNHVVFAAGQYAPHTTAGRHLLAHELAHTMQQRGGAAPMIQRRVWCPPGVDPEEGTGCMSVPDDEPNMSVPEPNRSEAPPPRPPSASAGGATDVWELLRTHPELLRPPFVTPPVLPVDPLDRPGLPGSETRCGGVNCHDRHGNMRAGRQWSCDASCNLEGKEAHCTGRVTGSATGPSEEAACRAAKRVATQSAPRGCYARHCQCSCARG